MKVGGYIATRKNPVKEKKKELDWNVGHPNEKQKQAFLANTLYVGYGGAKGGGKTWFIQHKAIGGALQYPGIKILILRAHYPELEQNHINPIKTLVAPLGITSYNGTTHLLKFDLGDDKPVSYIQFGHWSGDESENEYNGLEFDWINPMIVQYKLGEMLESLSPKEDMVISSQAAEATNVCGRFND